MTEEAEDGYEGSNQRNEPKPETTEQGGDRSQKAKTKTWSDVVKGLEEDKSKTTDSVGKNELDEMDPVKAERTWR